MWPWTSVLTTVSPFLLPKVKVKAASNLWDYGRHSLGRQDHEGHWCWFCLRCKQGSGSTNEDVIAGLERGLGMLPRGHGIGCGLGGVR